MTIHSTFNHLAIKTRKFKTSWVVLELVTAPSASFGVVMALSIIFCVPIFGIVVGGVSLGGGGFTTVPDGGGAIPGVGAAAGITYAIVVKCILFTPTMRANRRVHIKDRRTADSSQHLMQN
jgi:hypothetical protein